MAKVGVGIRGLFHISSHVTKIKGKRLPIKKMVNLGSSGSCLRCMQYHYIYKIQNLKKNQTKWNKTTSTTNKTSSLQSMKSKRDRCENPLVHSHKALGKVFFKDRTELSLSSKVLLFLSIQMIQIRHN